MFKFQDGQYLTEDSLYYILCDLFGKELVKRQVRVGNLRVDFTVSDKLIIEFDGYRHYSNYKNLMRDFQLYNIFGNEGFVDIMHVPYFMQWPYVCECLGRKDADFGFAYKNGFIDSKAMRPKDFTMHGAIDFVLQLDTFTDTVRDEILATMDSVDMDVYNFAVGAIKRKQ